MAPLAHLGGLLAEPLLDLRQEAVADPAPQARLGDVHVQGEVEGRVAEVLHERDGERVAEHVGVLAAPADATEQAGAAAFGISYQVAAFAPASGWTNVPAGSYALTAVAMVLTVIMPCGSLTVSWM